MQEVVCIRVLREVTGHRAEDTHIVHALCDFWEELTYLNTALAVFLERPRGFEKVVIVVELSDGHLHRQWLAMVKRQARLWVKRVHLTWTAIHVEEDDPLRALLMVQFGDDLRACGCPRRIIRREPGERERAETICGTAQQLPA